MALPLILGGVFFAEMHHFHCAGMRVSCGIFVSQSISFFWRNRKDNDEVQQAYRAYVTAWKLKDTAAQRNVISDDYMAINFEGKVSDKENKIATAKADPEWIST
jgi:hypothetical protein